MRVFPSSFASGHHFQDRRFQIPTDFSVAVFWSNLVIPQMDMELGDAERELWEKLESFCEAREVHKIIH